MIARGGGIHSAKIVAEILEFYDTFMKQEYPLPKMTSVAIPDFQGKSHYYDVQHRNDNKFSRLLNNLLMTFLLSPFSWRNGKLVSVYFNSSNAIIGFSLILSLMIINSF